jgi:hypothetical protein
MRNPEVTLRLAAYARECVPESERILVLWFAPEIYYYSDRLMATRHAFFLEQFGDLPYEREMEMDKVRAFASDDCLYASQVRALREEGVSSAHGIARSRLSRRRIGQG